jgi:Fe-S cluster assembly scaffold protein SufB
MIALSKACQKKNFNHYAQYKKEYAKRPKMMEYSYQYEKKRKVDRLEKKIERIKSNLESLNKKRELYLKEYEDKYNEAVDLHNEDIRNCRKQMRIYNSEITIEKLKRNLD